MRFNEFSLLIQDVVISNPANVQKLALKAGKNCATLVREANPYDGGAKLSVDTLMCVMEANCDVRPLVYMAHQMGLDLKKL